MSVLRVTPSGALEVVATSGDARLGGNDFDSALLGWLRKERQARLGTASESSDPQVSRQLAQAAEEAKKRLSVVKTVMVPLGTTLVKAGTTPGTTPGTAPGTAPGTTAGTAGPQAPAEELAVELSRATLEKLCDDLFRRLKRPLYEVSLSAQLTLPGELDPEYGTVRKKLDAKKRRAAAALRPEGKQRYLPTGSPVDEIVLVGGGTHMVAVRESHVSAF